MSHRHYMLPEPAMVQTIAGPRESPGPSVPLTGHDSNLMVRLLREHMKEQKPRENRTDKHNSEPHGQGQQIVACVQYNIYLSLFVA